MPTGREKPGEHWNARIIREEAERKTEIATATKLGFELGKSEGRKQAGEEMAAAFEAFFPDPHEEGDECQDCILVHEFAKIARNLTSQPQEATSEPLTASTGHSDLPEDGRAGSIRIPGGEG
jgi:hypothetical protein